MSSNSDFWTAARIARLCAGIARRENRRVIAQALGATKNAVIGKARRLGLSVPRLLVSKASMRKHRLARAERRAQRRRHVMNDQPEPSLHPEPPPERPRRIWKPVSRPQPPSEQAYGNPVTIEGLDIRTCRWPLWPDSGPIVERLYCGGLTIEGQPYCHEHSVKAYGGRR